ncbi:hypothetical protein G6F24_018501 [Rhizopus arrhizus]|nr:hypothetical protein G6F24_018501 [Rhizopus arrhizus]
MPLDIIEELENTPPQQLQDNLKQFKREAHKYVPNDWTTPETINRNFLPNLKKSQKILAFKPAQQLKSMNNWVTSSNIPRKWTPKKPTASYSKPVNKPSVWQSLGGSM